ncbi:hypothetical protein CBL_12701 [Carabus blaptoides fortunei]
MAVVQLRVDPHGRAYSTLAGDQQDPPVAEQPHQQHQVTREHVDAYHAQHPPAPGSVTAETVSTLIEDFAEDCPVHSRQADRNAELRCCIERFHVLALGRIDEESEPSYHMVEARRSPYCSSTRRPHHSPVCRLPLAAITNDGRASDVGGGDMVLVNDKRVGAGTVARGEVLDGNCNRQCFGVNGDVPLDARKTATLYRHYYPEGGWGWVIVVCSVLVHILNHGIQLSCSLLASPAYKKFHAPPVNTAGEFCIN